MLKAIFASNLIINISGYIWSEASAFLVFVFNLELCFSIFYFLIYIPYRFQVSSVLIFVGDIFWH